jgi:DNA repair protein RadC
MAENPHDGHRERLRSRFRESTLAAFAPHEALELLLSYCIPKRDVNPLAHKLIDHFGSFSQVLDAAPEELEKVPGIGSYSATFLCLIAQVAGYYQRDKFRKRQSLLTAPEMGRYCASLFINDTSEKLYLISLNIHGQLISRALICSGSLDELVIYPRDVVNAALRSNAAAVALTHNHPGGSLYPSDADMRATRDIRRALNAIDVVLLDHIIVGDGRYSSMAATGRMDDDELRSQSPMFNAYMDYLQSDDCDADYRETAGTGSRRISAVSADSERAAEKGSGRSRKR